MAFHVSVKWQGLFTGIDDLAGACQKLLLFEQKKKKERKIQQSVDHRESGVNVPDGETQEFNWCLWFHNRVVSLSLSQLALMLRAQPA